ncbi:DUF2721 domain-containing protein [Hymenobacter cellulosilyticus]|uniref:DUF2721 domain-containing protein n=1 Tax=Hymenobacter cellulosilyticus TaxID=2932248 RepID=A0A8T9Q2V0_9BACT|nr:DUF2721 domain-containing protein [Hymenobacter cellulosilyticus]UOQ72056.1 DUF2721 domain-containing protein [Hymenobacter cellulosilyticus]
MEITLTTPALLFPALSLLLLAYTNRFLALVNIVRTLKTQYKTTHSPHLIQQIHNLRRRVEMVRNMQAVGVGSMLGCVLAMFLIYAGFNSAGAVVFGGSLLALLVSLGMSLYEIQISVVALQIELNDLEENEEQRLAHQA